MSGKSRKVRSEPLVAETAELDLSDDEEVQEQDETTTTTDDAKNFDDVVVFGESDDEEKAEDRVAGAAASTNASTAAASGGREEAGSDDSDGSDEEEGGSSDDEDSVPSDADTEDVADEYGSDSDDSDDDAERNRIGDVPLQWYENEDHIGYDASGERVAKTIKKSEIDALLNRHDNPDAWRTITDVKNQQEIRLSDRDLEVLHRIRQHMFPLSSTETEITVEYDNPEEKIHPTTNRPEKKSRFLPSKWEGQKIKKLVRLYREGKLDVKPKPKPEVFDIWEEDTPERRRPPTALLAPKMALPTHAESFNPPAEYLFTEREKQEWEEMDESERPTSFIPQKYGSLRKVPAYPKFITERFERCLDLYLVPRALKKRMNVDKESLLPKLPSPADLRPFPMRVSVKFEGHTKLIRTMSIDCSGRFLATGSDDGYCLVWCVRTGRPVRRLKLGHACQSVAFSPTDVNVLAVASESDLYILNLGLHQSWASATDEFLCLPEEAIVQKSLGKEGERKTDDVKEAREEGVRLPAGNEVAPQNTVPGDDDPEGPSNFKKSLLKEVVWRPVLPASSSKASSSSSKPPVDVQKRSALLYEKGARIHIEHDGLVKQLEWHKSGNYLSAVAVNCSSKANQCIIHALATKKSIKPFGKLKTGSGVTIQATSFHPTKAHFFVATQRSIRVFHLQKLTLVKQMNAGARWISSMSVHPDGDHLIVGTLDRCLMWFDLELGKHAYKTFKYHERGVRQVAFYGKVAPHAMEVGGSSSSSSAAAQKPEEEAGASSSCQTSGKKLPSTHYPLMCTASDDGTVHVFHARVYKDLMTNPLIVPVKKLAGHERRGNYGVMDCVWHPSQPWVFTAGADGKALLWV